MLVAFEGQVRTQKSDWVQIDDRLCNLVLALAVMKMLLSLKVGMKKNLSAEGLAETGPLLYEPRYEKTGFTYAKTKTQISFAVTAKLINAFVSATRIVQSFFYLNPKFQASNHPLIVQSLYFLYTKFQASGHLVWLHSLVCVRPCRKPPRPVFSQ